MVTGRLRASPGPGMPGPYRAAFGRVLTCITAVGRHALMPPKVRVAARSTDGHRVCAIGCRGRRPRCPASAWQPGVYGQPPGRADVYEVGCRGGIYPSRGACGSGNTHGASRTPPPTTGSLCVSRPGMGNTARSRRPVGRPPYVPLLGLFVGRGDPTPPKVYVVTRSTDGRRVCAIGCRERRPRRPAGVRQTRVHGQPPGRACPAPTARLWAGVTCITAVGRHAPMPPKSAWPPV